MSVPPAPSPTGVPVRRGSRRASPRLAALAVTVCSAVICAGVVYLGESHRVRLDLTATGEHTLTARTRTILSSLREPCRLIAVVEQGRLDPASRRLVSDVLDAFDRARSGGMLRVSVIDPASPGGRTAYEALIADLAGERREAIESHRRAVAQGLDAVESIGSAAASAAEAVETARAALPASDPRREAWGQRAATMRVRGSDFLRLAESARPTAETTIGATILPASDRLREPLRAALAGIAREADATIAALSAGAGTTTADLKPAAAQATTLLASLRDDALRAADPLQRLGPLDILSVARALESGSTVVASTTGAAVATPLDRLFVARASSDGAGQSEGSLRFTGEEAIADAVSAVSGGPTPIVVFVHPVASPLLDDAGEPASPEAQQFFARLIDRLRSRGIGVGEWPIASRPDRPTAEMLHASAGRGRSTADRPIVWIAVPLAATTPRSAELTTKLARAVSSLIEAGENVLVSLEPSAMPRVGEVDPLAAALAPMGVAADTGRPLMRRLRMPQGSVVWPEFRAVGDAADAADVAGGGSSGADAHGSASNPIARAISGLATFLPWPSPLSLPDTPGVRAWPLLSILSDGDTWGETQWLSYRALAREMRASLPQSEQPAPDPGRDNIRGPWLVAAATERASPGASPDATATTLRQRLVVVGATAWFMDPVIEETEIIDGRRAPANPGNLELFENAVLWLGHRDALIAPGARSLAAPRIRAMTPEALGGLRWAVALGPPALVLLAGALYRVLRG